MLPNWSLNVLRMFESRSSSGSGLRPPPVVGHRLDLGVGVGKLDLHRRLLLDPVAVHVDRFEDALRQVLLDRRRQLGDEEVQEDRELLPLGVRVRQDRGEEAVGAQERLGLALEVHLPVLVELLPVDGDAGVEDRVEPVAVRAAEVQRHEFVDLRGGIDLVAVERGLQVVQLVRVGLLGEDRRAVVVGERLLDRVGVVHEVEHEHVVLLRVRAIQARQRLHRLDAREHPCPRTSCAAAARRSRSGTCRRRSGSGTGPPGSCRRSGSTETR